MRIFTWLIATTLLCVAPAAHAQEGSWTLGLGASFSGEDFDDTGGFDVDDSSALSAQLGYRFNRYLTLEAEYERIDGFDLDGALGTGLGTANLRGEIDGYIVSANAKVYPFSGRIRPYLMAGAGLARLDADVSASVPGVTAVSVSDDDTAAVLQVGLGFDLDLNDSWAIEVEGSYKLPQSDLDDLRFYTIGATLQYRF